MEEIENNLNVKISPRNIELNKKFSLEIQVNEDIIVNMGKPWENWRELLNIPFFANVFYSMIIL